MVSSELFDTNPRSQTSTPLLAKRLARHVVNFLALALAAYFAVAQVARWPDRLRYPGEEDAAEGTQLSEMVHLRRGVQIYRTPASGEFDGAIYGPLCYLAGAAVINPDRPAYLPLRLLSFTATLALAILSALFVFRLTKSKVGSTLAFLLFLGSAYVGRYGVSARADMVALLMAFGGFFIFYNNRQSRGAVIGAAGLMLLSFFYKQQFIGAAVSVFIYLILSRRFRQALEFAAILGAGGLALLAIFSFLVFPHQPFLLHFVSYNHLPFEKDLVLPEILMFVIPLFVPLLGSADFVDHHPDKLLTCYVVTSAAVYFLLLFSSGSGADTNRCLEPLTILTCLMAARIATTSGTFGAIAWLGALAFTLTIVALLSTVFVVPRVRPEDFASDKALQEYLRGNFPAGTSALTYYAGDPIRAGLEAPVTNLWHYSALIRKGVLSDHDIVSRIDHCGYGVILLDFDLVQLRSDKTADFYTAQSMRDAVLRSYQQAARLELPTPEITRYSEKAVYVWTPRCRAGNHK